MQINSLFELGKWVTLYFLNHLCVITSCSTVLMYEFKINQNSCGEKHIIVVLFPDLLEYMKGYDCLNILYACTHIQMEKQTTYAVEISRLCSYSQPISH